MNHKPILLVEDNPDDEILTIRALKQHNIVNEVVVARDGVEALDYLFGENRSESSPIKNEPALILLDIKLPKIDGIEVLKRIRAHEQTKLLRVVMLTSSNEQRDLIASYTLGVNSYVRKPVDFSEFVRAVKEIGSYWLLLNEAPPNRNGVTRDKTASRTKR